MSRDPRVDAYIAGSADFARPILIHLRELVHRALGDADEAIKWGRPHFTVAGKNVAGMSAFKAHCAFIIHGEGRQGEALGEVGKITCRSDLPADDALIARLEEARRRVRDAGSAVRRQPRLAPKPEIVMPPQFAEALARASAAQGVYAGFSPSARREYLEWITEAKTDTTRDRRIAQAVEWIGEGKKRNWKYERC